MKKATLLAAFVFVSLPVFAWEDRYEIEQNPYGSDSSEIQMRQKYNYDPSDRYRGNIDNDGYTRMRDLNGNTLRGYIEDDGYGKLRDQNGNTYRVRPQ
jgi:hypothetical protein